MSGLARKPRLAGGSSRKASPASWLLQGSGAGRERWEAAAFVGASLLTIQTAGLVSVAAMSGTARRPRKASPASWLLQGSGAGRERWEVVALVGASVLAIQTAGLVSGAAMSRTARRPRKASPASWLLQGSGAGRERWEVVAFVGASVLAIQTAGLVSVAAMSGLARKPHLAAGSSRKASPASLLLQGSDAGLNCKEAAAFVGASLLAIQTAGLVSVAAMSGAARRPRKASPASWLLHGSDAGLKCREASALGGARGAEPLLANQAHRPDFSPFPMLRGYP